MSRVVSMPATAKSPKRRKNIARGSCAPPFMARLFADSALMRVLMTMRHTAAPARAGAAACHDAAKVQAVRQAAHKARKCFCRKRRAHKGSKGASCQKGAHVSRRSCAVRFVAGSSKLLKNTSSKASA